MTEQDKVVCACGADKFTARVIKFVPMDSEGSYPPIEEKVQRIVCDNCHQGYITGDDIFEKFKTRLGFE